MKYEVLVDGISRALEIERQAKWQPARASRRKVFDADAVEIVPGTFSILVGGRVFEAQVLPGKGSLSVRCAGTNSPSRCAIPRLARIA